MTTWFTRKRAHSLAPISLAAAAVLAAALAACTGKAANQQASAGTLDSSTVQTSAQIDAVGPGVHVTRTDEASVNKSTEYKLTDDNFTKFVAAADSLSALGGRDSASRAFLATDLTDAGAKTIDAGLKWLESNATVSNAINSAGISTRDYFVQSIAIASAQRFMNNPNAAPPTPTTKENAEFLRAHQQQLQHVQGLTPPQ